MLDLVFIGGGEMSAHSSMVVGDDDTAFACWSVRIDAVLDVQT